MVQDIDGERYYTIKEAAGQMGIHWRTVWRWTVEKKIKFYQVAPGHKILIPQHAINGLK